MAKRGRPPKIRAQQPAGTFAGKPPQSTRQALRWVLDNLAVENIEPNDCPSAKAWFFYAQARNDEDFAKQLALRFVPSRTELTHTQGFADDGRDVRERLAAIHGAAAGRGKARAGTASNQKLPVA